SAWPGSRRAARASFSATTPNSGKACRRRRRRSGNERDASPMTQPPRAVLFDLDDTLLVAFRPSASPWRRVLGASAGALGGLAATVLIDAIEDTSRALWADPGRHRYWRQRIGEARRRIVATAFAELASAGHAVPGRAVSDALADAYNAMHEAELRMFPG